MMSGAVPRSEWLVAKKTIPITTAISATSPLRMASWRDERVGMGDTVKPVDVSTTRERVRVTRQTLMLAKRTIVPL